MAKVLQLSHLLSFILFYRLVLAVPSKTCALMAAYLSDLVFITCIGWTDSTSDIVDVEPAAVQSLGSGTLVQSQLFVPSAVSKC